MLLGLVGLAGLVAAGCSVSQEESAGVEVPPVDRSWPLGKDGDEGTGYGGDGDEYAVDDAAAVVTADDPELGL
jgi:hypothetical protein